MRIWHRYLGFFLAGIMAVYAISGVVLIFRNTDVLKRDYVVEQMVEPNLSAEELGKAIGKADLEFDGATGTVFHFEKGSYYIKSGQVVYTVRKLPYILDKMTKFHKAKSGEPLFYLNIFFGYSLLFFVISSFWMFIPGSKIFKKSMYFTAGGILLALIILFV